MATITVSVKGTSLGEVTITEILEGANSDRLMAYLLMAYGRDSNGNPRTPSEIIAAYWQGVREDLFSRISQYDQEIAAQAARDAVTGIQSTTEISVG